MKKRLFCLFLCLLTVLPIVLTACGDSTKSGTEGEEMTITFTDDTVAMTVVLYSICNESTTDEAIARVQDALNEITESNFKTHVELRLYPENEYKKILEEKMAVIEEQTLLKNRLSEAADAANRAVKGAGVTTSPELREQMVVQGDDDEETAEETQYVAETKVNELGFAETVYPTATPNQLDIFLITDYETYTKYADEELICELDNELNIGSSILKSYINPMLLDSVKYDGVTYGIPNNHAIGDYEFILINRELADKYYFDINSISSMGDLTDYLDVVIAHEPDYVPMVNFGSDLGYYINNKPSMVGAYISSDAFASVGTEQFVSTISPRLMFAFRQFNKYYITKYNYRNYITYADSIDGMDKVACAVLTGDLNIREQYSEDYYVITYKSPILYQDEIFSSVYAISKYASNTSRCMEIVELLTTNEQFRNVFQYGVEGVDYEIDSKTGIVHSKSDEYSMDARYTGNQFKLWPNDGMTEGELLLAENNWALGKQQNTEAAIDPLYGFVLEEDPDVLKGKNETADGAETSDSEEESYHSVAEMVAKFDELYEDFHKRYDAFEPYTMEDGTYVDIELFITLLSQEYSSYSEVTDSFSRDYNYSLTNQVESWYKEKYNLN